MIVGPVISRDLFFLRELSVPKAALGALPKILDQEVLRRTPFQLSDIWHAASVVARRRDDVVAMCHWIIRRDRAEAALSELGLKRGMLIFWRWPTPMARPCPSSFFVPQMTKIRLGRPRCQAAGDALHLAPSCSVWPSSNGARPALPPRSRRRSSTPGKARKAVAMAPDPAARLFAMKADAGILEVWDELSRILPDHTFLTESAHRRRQGDGVGIFGGCRAAGSDHRPVAAVFRRDADRGDHA